MRTLALALVSAIGVQVQAQTTWQSMPAPFASNMNFNASFDTLRNQVHLIDGLSHQVFNGTQWQTVSSIPLFVYQTAYDPLRDRTLAVGWGAGQTRLYGFDGSSWAQLTATVPFPEPYGMVWHAQRQTIVAFSDAGLHEWDGVAWAAIGTTVAQPPPTGSRAYDVYYDGNRDMIVVASRSVQTNGLMWEWNVAQGWQQVVTSQPGIPFVHFGFDPVRNRHVGVASPSFAALATSFSVNEVWERIPDNVSPWEQKALTPAVTGDGPLVWDPTLARLIIVVRQFPGPGGASMFGYKGDYPSLYHGHRDGCTGSGALIDSLRAATDLPHAGSIFVTDVVSTSSQLGVLVSGLSDQFASGAPLPLSLTSLGMGNCLLRVSPDLLTVMLPAAPGTLRASVQLGPGPTFLGFEFFQQALIFKPGVNAFGAVLTDSRRGVKGQP